MMYDGYHFWGMPLFWWVFWLFLLVLVFGWFKPVPKRRIRRDSPLDILQKRFASGEITTEEYEQKKKILESDVTIGETDTHNARINALKLNMEVANSRRGPTNWYVITGGPSSGKTTTVNLLRERGYKTTIEHARHYLDTQRADGRTVEEVRKNQQEFQLGVLNMQIEQEAEISPDDVVFLDRAIPDALAYYRFLDLPPDKKLSKALATVSYRKIFILDCLPLVKDYARHEDEAAQKKIHQLLTEVYEALLFPVVHVPVLPPEERADFILENL